MPYLSHNYRFERKSRLKNLLEAMGFFVVSAVAILFTLVVLGWFSVVTNSNRPAQVVTVQE